MAKSVAVDTLPDARRSYVFAGPAKSLIVGDKTVLRGEAITLDGSTIKQLVQYGSQFSDGNGVRIRTQAQIDAMLNPVTDANTPTGDSNTPVTP